MCKKGIHLMTSDNTGVIAGSSVYNGGKKYCVACKQKAHSDYHMNRVKKLNKPIEATEKMISANGGWKIPNM